MWGFPGGRWGLGGAGGGEAKTNIRCKSLSRGVRVDE